VSSSWTTEQLSRIEQARELEIASRRRDGTLGHRLPIWVVTVDGQVYVRSWHRRTTGWFGQVIKNRQAHVRVQGLDADVAVEDIGAGDPVLRSAVDDAYRAKYAPHGGGSVGQMTTEAAAATTLRLSPA
jgi:hypothetical protein